MTPRVPQRGFTLLELLLALALLAVLSASLFVFLSNMLNARERILERTEQHAGASRLIDTLDSALLHTLAQTSGGRSGVRGDARSIEVFGLVVSARENADDAAQWSGRRGVSLRFDEDTGEVLATFEDDVGESEEEILAEGIDDVRFRYSDGSGWRSSFDSASGGLPAAIEVALWYRRGVEEEEDEFDELPSGFDEEALRSIEEEAALFAASDIPEPTPAPDRIRILRVLDGAASAPASGSTGVPSVGGPAGPRGRG